DGSRSRSGRLDRGGRRLGSEHGDAVGPGPAAEQASPGLPGPVLIGAVLIGAVLIGAVLIGAVLLFSAILARAVLGGTIAADAVAVGPRLARGGLAGLIAAPARLA